MCVVSMVSDHWSRRFEPYVQPNPPANVSTFFAPRQFTEEEVALLRKMIADYQESMSAAKKVDDLTGQPDCADAEKLKLQERVKELEAQLEVVRKAVSP